MRHDPLECTLEAPPSSSPLSAKCPSLLLFMFLYFSSLFVSLLFSLFFLCSVCFLFPPNLFSLLICVLRHLLLHLHLLFFSSSVCVFSFLSYSLLLSLLSARITFITLSSRSFFFSLVHFSLLLYMSLPFLSFPHSSLSLIISSVTVFTCLYLVLKPGR